MKTFPFDLELFRYSTEVLIRWSDLDAFQHVNNAVYLTYFEQGRIEYFTDNCIPWDWKNTGAILARAEIDYGAPLHFGDNAKIYIRCSRIGNKSVDFEYVIMKSINPDDTLPVAWGKTVLVAYQYASGKSVELPHYAVEALVKIDNPIKS